MARVRSVLRFIARSGKRVGVAIVGFALIAVGLVMLVTPGPGLLIIIAGLAVLATEFAWARRALDQAKLKAREAARKASERARFRRSTGRPAVDPDSPMGVPPRPGPSPGSTAADPDGPHGVPGAGVGGDPPEEEP